MPVWEFPSREYHCKKAVYPFSRYLPHSPRKIGTETFQMAKKKILPLIPRFYKHKKSASVHHYKESLHTQVLIFSLTIKDVCIVVR